MLGRITNKMRNKVCKLKNKRNIQKKKSVLFQINCNECCVVSIRETKRTTWQRMSKHHTAVEKRDKTSHIDKNSIELKR